MKKDPQITPKYPSRDAVGVSPKAVKMKVYHVNRTWLLKVSKEDAEWMRLESGEELVLNFPNRRRGSE